MKSGRMLLEEALRIRHLQNAVIEVLKRLISDTSAPFFNSYHNGIHIYYMVADFCHQLCQNHSADTWETFRPCQVIHGQLLKPLVQADLPCYIIKLFSIVTVKPIGDKIVAICLVGHRNKSVQTGKVLLPHGAGSDGQQQINCQSPKVWFLLGKATALPGTLRCKALHPVCP